MDATLGQVQRQTHQFVIFFVTIAAALLVGLAGGYGIRAWTFSSQPQAVAAVQALPKVVPGYGLGAWNTGGFVAPLTHTTVPAWEVPGQGVPARLPDRNDITNGSNNSVPARLPDRSDITNGSNNSNPVNHRGDARLGGRS